MFAALLSNMTKRGGCFREMLMLKIIEGDIYKYESCEAAVYVKTPTEHMQILWKFGRDDRMNVLLWWGEVLWKRRVLWPTSGRPRLCAALSVLCCQERRG